MSNLQGDNEDWIKARLGKVTASRMADLTAKTKTGYGASRANYMAEKLIERLTGKQADTFKNDAMRWGTEQEPFARTAYEFYKSCDVEQVGFIDHPLIIGAGASPDGLVGSDGMIEIKAPNTSTHLETLETETIPQRYMLQMQFQMASCKRLWCDFVSFDPRLPEEMRLFIKRVDRNSATIDMLETETQMFLDELNRREKLLREKYADAA